MPGDPFQVWANSTENQRKMVRAFFKALADCFPEPGTPQVQRHTLICNQTDECRAKRRPVVAGGGRADERHGVPVCASCLARGVAQKGWVPGGLPMPEKYR